MSEYCGFICSDYVEKAKEIRKALDEFAKYNPGEAKVVLGNILDAIVPETKPLISQYLNAYIELQRNSVNDASQQERNKERSQRRAKI